MDYLVLGGPRWDPESNQPSLQVVLELSKSGRVMYVFRERQDSGLRRALGLGFEAGYRDGERLRSNAPTMVAPNLWALPLGGIHATLPLSVPMPLRWLQASLIERKVRRALDRLGFQECVLWMYWWFFPGLVRKLGLRTIYDVIDEHDAYPFNASLPIINRVNRALERRTAKQVDLVVCVSAQGHQRLESIAKGSIEAANGVDLERINTILGESQGSPRQCDRPIVGYVGGITGRIDWSLVRYAAHCLSNIDFVFAGGWRPDVGASLPDNIYFLGPMGYADIVRHIRLFDVGTMPFLVNDFTTGSSFLKIFDYLSVACPVVSTPLAAAWRAANEFGSWIQIAETREQWVQAIDRTTAARREGNAFRDPPDLQQHSVEARVERILASLAESDGNI